MITLNYIERKDVGDSTSLRETGYIPAVFYGKKQATTSVAVKTSEFIKTWKQAGESSVVSLSGSLGKIDVLIHDVDVHPVSEMPRHADFYVFEKGKKIEVSIPLIFVGVSPAVKDLGGNLVKVMHEVNIEASPENLPHDISIDISSLVDFDSQILASDLVLPNGVTLVDSSEDVVVSVSAPKAEEVDEPVAAPDLSTIEVAKKGKKEDEEGASAE
ncbi:MAG: 50S ribosomal protein L25 [Candidatus Zambryskibacteria bacterium]|nr:50S ribosomal protein L25 [Candidatus Zambryskibacteria bacterium]